MNNFTFGGLEGNAGPKKPIFTMGLRSSSESIAPSEPEEYPLLNLFAQRSDETPSYRFTAGMALMSTQRNNKLEGSYIVWAKLYTGGLSGWIAARFKLDGDSAGAIADEVTYGAYRSEGQLVILVKTFLDHRPYRLYFQAVRHYYTENYNLKPIDHSGDEDERFRLAHDPGIVVRCFRNGRAILDPEYGTEQTDQVNLEDNSLIHRVIQLNREGLSQRKIAAQLGIAQSAISRMLKKASEENSTITAAE